MRFSGVIPRRVVRLTPTIIQPWFYNFDNRRILRLLIAGPKSHLRPLENSYVLVVIDKLNELIDRKVDGSLDRSVRLRANYIAIEVPHRLRGEDVKIDEFVVAAVDILKTGLAWGDEVKVYETITTTRQFKACNRRLGKPWSLGR